MTAEKVTPHLLEEHIKSGDVNLRIGTNIKHISPTGEELVLYPHKTTQIPVAVGPSNIPGLRSIDEGCIDFRSRFAQKAANPIGEKFVQEFPAEQFEQVKRGETVRSRIFVENLGGCPLAIQPDQEIARIYNGKAATPLTGRELTQTFESLVEIQGKWRWAFLNNSDQQEDRIGFWLPITYANSLWIPDSNRKIVVPDHVGPRGGPTECYQQLDKNEIPKDLPIFFLAHTDTTKVTIAGPIAGIISPVFYHPSGDLNHTTHIESRLLEGFDQEKGEVRTNWKQIVLELYGYPYPVENRPREIFIQIFNRSYFQ